MKRVEIPLGSFFVILFKATASDVTVSLQRSPFPLMFLFFLPFSHFVEAAATVLNSLTRLVAGGNSQTTARFGEGTEKLGA